MLKEQLLQQSLKADHRSLAGSLSQVSLEWGKVARRLLSQLHFVTVAPPSCSVPFHFYQEGEPGTGWRVSIATLPALDCCPWVWVSHHWEAGTTEPWKHSSCLVNFGWVGEVNFQKYAGLSFISRSCSLWETIPALNINVCDLQCFLCVIRGQEHTPLLSWVNGVYTPMN